MASLLCVNCGICVNRLERHLALQQDTRLISLLSEWISPRILTETDYVCTACRELAIRRVNQNLFDDGEASTSRPSYVGHTRVCILCGKSLLKRQSDAILRSYPSPIQQAIARIVSDLIQPRQLTSTCHLCHPCWLKMKKSATKEQQRHSSYSVESNVPVIVPAPTNDDEPSTQTLNEVQPTPAFSEEQFTLTVSHDHATQSVNEEQPFLLTLRDQEEQSIPTVGVGSSTQTSTATEQRNSIELNNYKRAANTASHCVFPECTRNTLHRISDSLRSQVLCDHKFYLPSCVRVCDYHLRNNLWGTLFESENSYTSFEVEHVEHVFSLVNRLESNHDFNNVLTIDDNLFHYWLGLSKDNFQTLLNEVPLITSTVRGVLGLTALLIKLRTGDSDDRISSLMKIPRRTLEGLMNKVREILIIHFVPDNLGIGHINRQQLLSKNKIIPNGVFDNENNTKAIIICDGTYIYINKSSNYQFQKDTYSLHKYRNLLKPFMIVSCDGYIIDCFGPYKATTSDADIMTSLFRDPSSALRQYFQENDVFILDRGFRDSISLLEECGYNVHMPESLLEGEHQLSTVQANKNRCITICRWVVEVVNGYFKRDFKLFRQEYFNRSLPRMMQDFQIAASILNKFALKIRNRSEATEIVQIINERKYLQNNLACIVEINNLNRRSSNFRSITADRDNLLVFPRMSYNDLFLFALGTYQIKQSRSYYGEHIRFHGGYRIEVCREMNIDLSELQLGTREVTLIRGKIKSRHVGRRQYFVYLLIDCNMSGKQGILEYCCNCLVGRRTVGCCAHIMTVVWYLGWARHEGNINPPAEFLDDIVIRDDFEE